MNSIQQKAPVIAGRGCLLCFIRATGKPTTAPAALRNTTKHYFEVSRYEIRL
jgi:hypothetical protein